MLPSALYKKAEIDQNEKKKLIMVIEVSREVSVMSPGTKEFIDVEREMNIESRKRNVQEKINR